MWALDESYKKAIPKLASLPNVYCKILRLLHSDNDDLLKAL